MRLLCPSLIDTPPTIVGVLAKLDGVSTYKT
jgi:hypothetical protein